MVRLFTVFTLALSLSAVVAGPEHRNHRRIARRSPHKARQCAARSSGGNDTASSSYGIDSTTSSTGTGSNGNSGSGSSSGGVVLTKKGHKHASATSSSVDSQATDSGTGNSSTAGTGNSSTADTGNSSSSGNTTESGSSSGNTTTTDTGSSSGNTTDTGSSSSGSSVVTSRSGVLPAEGTVAGWTLAAIQAPSNVQVIELDTSTFIMEHDMKALPHPVVDASGKKAIHAHFNKGAYDLKTTADIIGGFSFFSPGPSKSGSTPLVDLPGIKATEVSFGYSVMFSAGFQWNMGGKLPGMFGGENADVAATCSGGNHPDNCFSTRLMWRADGKGELYLYIPPSANRANLCGTTGTGNCVEGSGGKMYGASVGTGNFHFAAGAWTAVREVIHLNTPGKQDGWAAVYVNGATTPSIKIDNISYGAQQVNYFYGQQIQTFFGGHEPNWASPQDQDIWFADFSLAVTETQ